MIKQTKTVFKNISHLFLFLLLLGCGNQEKIIHSPNGNGAIIIYEKTDNTGKLYTYFGYGETKKEVNEYVRVRNKWRDGWDCILSGEGNRAIIYHPYLNFEGYNLGDRMDLTKMDARHFSKLFFNDEKDNYIRLSSYNYNKEEF